MFGLATRTISGVDRRLDLAHQEAQIAGRRYSATRQFLVERCAQLAGGTLVNDFRDVLPKAVRDVAWNGDDDHRIDTTGLNQPEHARVDREVLPILIGL